MTAPSEPNEPTKVERVAAAELASAGTPATDAESASSTTSTPAEKPKTPRKAPVRKPHPQRTTTENPTPATSRSVTERSGPDAPSAAKSAPGTAARKPTKTAAERAAAARSGAVRSTSARSTAARTSAARTAAAKSESATKASEARANAVKATAVRAAAAGAAAAEASATRAAAAEAASAKVAATRAEAAAAEEAATSAAEAEAARAAEARARAAEARAAAASTRAAAAETAAALSVIAARTVAESPAHNGDPPATPATTALLPTALLPAAPTERGPAEPDTEALAKTVPGDVRPVTGTPRADPARKAQSGAPAPVEIAVSGLNKRFGQNIAVSGIDLEVRAGSFYGIVGPNGAGKTTTLSMVTGLLRPDSGSITVHGIDVWVNPIEAKRIIGVLPDRLRLFDRLTGAQLLYYSGVLRGLEGETVRIRSADLAAAFGLEDALNRLVADYSAGMTKKIALACAMIHSPRLLVLDEPFESVDPVSAVNLTEILQKYVAAGGTVVLSSHGMDLIQRVCDHVAIIVQGKVLASGTIEEVRGEKTLEDRFVELAGGRKVAEGMEWLHSFSD